nr:hypothetical protein [Candidatus Woesearchaeota archaeon]
MPIRKFLTKRARDLLKSGDILSSIIYTSADLETLLFEKLFFERNIHEDLIGNWTLGRYIKWNLKLGTTDDKYAQMLTDFNILRNNVVHRRYYAERLAQNSEELKKVKKLLKKTLDFIGRTGSKYKWDLEKERIYSQYHDKISHK